MGTYLPPIKLREVPTTFGDESPGWSNFPKPDGCYNGKLSVYVNLYALYLTYRGFTENRASVPRLKKDRQRSWGLFLGRAVHISGIVLIAAYSFFVRIIFKFYLISPIGTTAEYVHASRRGTYCCPRGDEAPLLRLAKYDRDASVIPSLCMTLEKLQHLP